LLSQLPRYRTALHDAHNLAALNDGFYLSFRNVEPTGKKYLLAFDVSGSMGMPLRKSPLTVREAAAAMGMATARVEPWHHCIGFTHRLADLDISPTMRLDQVVNAIMENFGPTDCAKPMLAALRRGWEVVVFVVYTDNETGQEASNRPRPSGATGRQRAFPPS